MAVASFPLRSLLAQGWRASCAPTRAHMAAAMAREDVEEIERPLGKPVWRPEGCLTREDHMTSRGEIELLVDSLQLSEVCEVKALSEAVRLGGSNTVLGAWKQDMMLQKWPSGLEEWRPGAVSSRARF